MGDVHFPSRAVAYVEIGFDTDISSKWHVTVVDAAVALAARTVRIPVQSAGMVMLVENVDHAVALAK